MDANPLDFRDGSIWSSAVIQVYANWLIKLMDDLRRLEALVQEREPTNEETDAYTKVMHSIGYNVSMLKLRSSEKWIKRMQLEAESGMTDEQVARELPQFRIRILEDLGDRAFYCVTDPEKIERFFTFDPHFIEAIRRKYVHEQFDTALLTRFPMVIEDLEWAVDCYVTSAYTACVFHLMRVVEHGLMDVARIAGMEDPKPSWNNVIRHLEKLCFKTEYRDIPEGVKPYRDSIKELLPKMQAIEHAWRNRVMHVDNKLIPSEPIDKPIATDILNTVEPFMRMLAEKFPKGTALHA